MSEQAAQEQLQNALLTTFLANLAFLSEYDKELFIRVDELSKMIVEGVYKAKYQLEFIKENGDFDMYDLVNNKYMYKKKPKEWNNKIVRKVNFDEKDSILTLNKVIYQGNVTSIDENIKYNLEKINDGSILTINDISEYVNILKDKLDNKKKKLKKIKKFIFLGSLLGRHITRIANKIDANMYFVCEKNLEIFRLSLFTIDYTILAKNNGVIFSIMDDGITFENKMIKFLTTEPFDNYILKLSTTDINIEDYINRTLVSIVTIQPSSFDYNRLLYNFVRCTTEKLSSSYNTLLFNKTKESLNIFDNIPVLFIGAGPSLDDNISWILENQNKFFIVTMGASAGKLLKAGIKVDMIFSLDGQYDILDKKQFNVKTMPLLKDSIIITSMLTDRRILERFNPKNLFLFEVVSCFYKNNVTIQGFSVGEIAVGLLLQMNVKELYLVGLDLALHKDTGATHSLGTSSIRKYNKAIGNKKEFGLRTGLLEVKGNIEEKVVTTGVFSISVSFLNKLLLAKDNEVTVYNLSKHGVFFENTIPTYIEDINIDKYSDIKIKIKEVIALLNIYTSSSLQEEDIFLIKEEIDYIEEIIKKEFKNLLNDTSINFIEFDNIAKKLLIKLIGFKKEKNILSIIFKNYSQFLFPYFESHFNNIKVKNEEQKIKKIRAVFIIQVEKLIYDYLDYLKRIIK